MLLCAGLAASSGAIADALPDDPLQRRCWLESTTARTAPDLREPTAVRFVNLRNGDSVRSPFRVEFGIRGMGVIPAGNPHDKAGHHHVLVDTRLPLNYQDKIPFSDTHRHFGKGQTGTVLDLPPGTHTLRLLFADHDHRPHFVYSPEISINVAGKRADTPAPVIDRARFDATCALWTQDQQSTPRSATREVYVKNFRDAEPLASPFVASLGVAGFGVAPAGSKVKDSGHFSFVVSRAKTPVATYELVDGRTETLVVLANGEYELDLAFVGSDGVTLLRAPTQRLVVVRQNN